MHVIVHDNTAGGTDADDSNEDMVDIREYVREQGAVLRKGISPGAAATRAMCRLGVRQYRQILARSNTKPGHAGTRR